MRHFVSVFAGLSAALGLASCGEGAGDPAATASSSANGGTASASSASASSGTETTSSASSTGTGGSANSESVSRANGALSLSQTTDLYIFDYKWPAAAGSIPALGQLLEARMEQARRELRSQAAEAQTEAQEQDYPFRKHASDTEWKVVADTPRFLSLSSETYSYMGGAHGNTGFDALVWDKQGGLALDPIDLFESREAFDVMMGEPFCDALAAARVRKLGGEIAAMGEQDCPSVSETVLILGSRNGETFDRVGFLVPPYVAGAYAEGSYDVTLKVTPALKGIVKAEYRSAFTARE